MDSQDEINLGHKAKRETEAFINRHLNDQAKGWPKLCFAGPEYPGCRQEQRGGRCESTRVLSTQ